MKTTYKGFHVNTLRWIPRTMVKALAAGAVLVAAVLPLAVVSSAGATGTPTVTSLAFSQTLGGTSIPAGAMDNIGVGASFYVNVTGTNFAYDGATNVQLTTTAPGVTFLEVKETSATNVEAAIVTTGATTPGSYPVTVTDDNGTGTSTTNVLNVVAAPTITSVTPNSVPQGTGDVSVTITGTGFQDYTFLGSSGLPTIAVANATNGVALYQNSSETYVSSTELTVNLYGENSVTHPASAPAGTYNVTVTNTDQGTTELAGGFTVSASGITSLSPSAIATTATAAPVTITGAGFESGAVVTLSSCSATPVGGNGSLNTETTVVSSTEITTEIDANSSTGRCTVTVQNPAVASGGNNATIGSALGAFATGESAIGGAVITSTSLSPSAPVVVDGSTTETLTVTGTGFSSYTTLQAFPGTSSTADGAITFSSYVANSAGTTLTATVAAGSGAVAGSDGIQAVNTSSNSATSAAAFTVAGPAVASASPSASRRVPRLARSSPSRVRALTVLPRSCTSARAAPLAVAPLLVVSSR